jgi:hypothetical protein
MAAMFNRYGICRFAVVRQPCALRFPVSENIGKRRTRSADPHHIHQAFHIPRHLHKRLVTFSIIAYLGALPYVHSVVYAHLNLADVLVKVMYQLRLFRAAGLERMLAVLGKRVGVVARRDRGCRGCGNVVSEGAW